MSLQQKIKEETIKEKNIVYIAEHYRYLNTNRRLMTHGFKTKESLVANKGKISFTSFAVSRMVANYRDMYHTNTMRIDMIAVEFRIKELKEEIADYEKRLKFQTDYFEKATMEEAIENCAGQRYVLENLKQFKVKEQV